MLEALQGASLKIQLRNFQHNKFMKNIETKTLIEIDGAIITESIINAIKEFQDFDNDNVDMHMNFMTDAICFISKQFHEMEDEELREAAIIICNLTTTRNMIVKFKKP